jgi:hypothetical protein
MSFESVKVSIFALDAECRPIYGEPPKEAVEMCIKLRRGGAA